MGIAISPDQLTLAAVARSALAPLDLPGVAQRSLDDAPDDARLWSLVGELGWLGLPVEERFGGQGAGLAELLVVVEELGRVLASGSFLPTALAAAIIQAHGSDEQRATLLPGIVSGATTVAVGLHGTLSTTGSTLSGATGPVLCADTVDLLLLAVGEDLALVPRDAATVTEVRRDVDPTRTLATLTCSGSPVVGILAGAAGGARRLALLLASAEALGAMAACTELAVGYVKVREQFGRPVGTFMAVKHHCANMLVDVELATAAVWDATRSTSSEPEADLTVAVAAGLALPAALRLARLCIQLHGGIAFTWEHPAHLYLRRAMALGTAFGRVDDQLELITRLTGEGVRRHAVVDLPPEAESFRRDARALVAEHVGLPPEQRRSHLARSGYLVAHWPPPFGRSAGAVEQLVIDEELAAIERLQLGLGGWVLPAILTVATAEQVDRWIWDALEGRTRWCQLFSEPGAGSDAASVSTRGTRVEGGWRVDGQKVWSSDARLCQWGLATIRTDPSVAKHAGITTMAIDMAAPGITVRPLREITGESMFNEVFFDDVFVPDSDVVGEPGGGWAVTISTLGFERVSIGADVSSIPARDLVPILERHAPGDVGYARELGTLLAESAALRTLNHRRAARAVSAGTPGAEGTIAKLVGAEHQQRVTELGLRIAGAAVLLGEEPRLLRDSFYTRCLTIAGGTSEIVRTAIAERILGLPRDK